MGYEINWHVSAGDPVLSTPQYQKYSQYTFTELLPILPAIKGDLLAARASNESASVINYLMWLLRVIAAVG
jgi:hypothetical protein